MFSICVRSGRGGVFMGLGQSRFIYLLSLIFSLFVRVEEGNFDGRADEKD